MSIYRKPGNSLFGDFNVQPAHSANDATKTSWLPMSETQLHAEELREQADQSKRKKGEPLNVPLPRTLAWATDLPPEIRPRELIRLYARIANQIAGDWEEPDATRAYFQQLLASPRQHRKGFPSRIESELVALNLHYMLLHPDREGIDAWHDVRKR